MTTDSENIQSDLLPQPTQRSDRLALPYAFTLSETEHQELLEKMRYIPEHMDAGMPQLMTLSYQVDHAIREACLADPEQWREESGTFIFTSSNKLKVYLGRPGIPLPADEARQRIQALGISTVVIARIALGLWMARRSNRLLQTESGSVLIRLEEALEWRGLKKCSGKATGSDKRYSGGYRPEDKDAVLKDLDLLASCCIQGQITCVSDGKRIQEHIDSSYLHYSIITREVYRPGGVRAGMVVSPGNWLQIYEQHGNLFLSKTDRTVLQLNPQNQQHELKLMLFLTERWRQQKHDLEDPIAMAHLLAFSMIRADKVHLTARFAPRIQEALAMLQKQGIIGQLQCLTPIDTSQPQWGNAWLASQWVIAPPKEKVTRLTNTGSASHSMRTAEGPGGIRAIETIYAGYRFRSRSEARWAVFFEKLRIDYRYELEGFDFDGIRYLPDFWLPKQNCWLEIKGQAPTEEELRKAHLLSLHLGKPTYIFFGDIWLPSQQKYGGAYRCSGSHWDQGYYWYECRRCKMLGPASPRETGHFPCQCTNRSATQDHYDDTSDRLVAAYRAARQARFEYGEQRRK